MLFPFVYTEAGTGTVSKSMDGGVIAGIICAVVAVLLAIGLFICWWRYPHWFFQREKPFNSFIKVEMQPYNHYHAPRRVSRVDSNASECEEKRYSFRNNAHNATADVTACPIYASIADSTENEATVNGSVSSTHKFHRHSSDMKPLKKGWCSPVISTLILLAKILPQCIQMSLSFLNRLVLVVTSDPLFRNVAV